MPRRLFTLVPILATVVLVVGLVGAPAEASSTRPTATSLSSTAGPIAGGKTVTIRGKHFTKSAKVQFGFTYATKVKKISSTKLTAVTPKHSAGLIHVRVTTSHGTSKTSSAGGYTFRKLPVISSVTPSTGSVKGGPTVTIKGKYFTASTKVRFGSHYSSKVKKVSSKQLTVRVPSHSAGSFHVWAKSSGGTSTVDGPLYTYLGAPTVSSLSSNGGSSAGGSKITISGNGFVSGAVVHFDKTKASSVKVSSPTTLTAVTPKHAIEPTAVTVTTPYGTSKASRATTYQYGTAAQLRVKVGSFNVRVGSGYDSSRGPYEQPWTKRVTPVVKQITDESLDVFGVQEASASKKYTATGVPQFQDLANRLKSPYALTNDNRYCTKSDSAGRCATGASSSDRIIYKTSRLSLLGEGSRKLDETTPTDGSGRYMEWAIFQDKRTDKKFFFVNTHLEPNKGGVMQGTVRALQAAIILSEITAKNTANLPTILVGDLATSKFDKQPAPDTNVAHDTLVSAGFADPLVNTHKYKGTTGLPSTLVNTQYSSLNYFDAAPQQLAGYAISSYVDYILTRGAGFTYDTWKTVVDLDSKGNFAGVIPSDHNLIDLTVGLP